MARRPSFYYNFRHPKKAAFLAAFREGASIKKAAAECGVDRSLVYYWLEHDADFLAAYGLAKVDAVETMEDEARRRAMEGVRKEKPIFSAKGHLLATVIETDYSDTLMIFLLKGLAPEKYRERVDVQGTQTVKTIDADAWESV